MIEHLVMIRTSGNWFVLAVVIVGVLAVVVTVTIRITRNHAIIGFSESGSDGTSTAVSPLNKQDSSVHAEADLGTAVPVPTDSPDVLPLLNEDVIRSLFCSILDEDAFSYRVDDISWSIATFCGVPHRREALVKLSDSNQCHASHMFELWLLEYSQDWRRECMSGWKIVKKIADADLLSFKPVDVDGDGIFEVFVNEYFLGNGGHDTMRWKVLRINEYKDCLCEVLYSADGHDDRGSLDQGEVLVWHAITFIDMYSDGRVEIVDTEHAEDRVSAKEGEIGKRNVGSEETVTVWMLSGNKYVPIGSIPAT